MNKLIKFLILNLVFGTLFITPSYALIEINDPSRGSVATWTLAPHHDYTPLKVSGCTVYADEFAYIFSIDNLGADYSTRYVPITVEMSPHVTHAGHCTTVTAEHHFDPGDSDRTCSSCEREKNCGRMIKFPKDSAGACESSGNGHASFKHCEGTECASKNNLILPYGFGFASGVSGPIMLISSTASKTFGVVGLHIEQQVEVPLPNILKGKCNTTDEIGDDGGDEEDPDFETFEEEDIEDLGGTWDETSGTYVLPPNAYADLENAAIAADKSVCKADNTSIPTYCYPDDPVPGCFYNMEGDFYYIKNGPTAPVLTQSFMRDDEGSLRFIRTKTNETIPAEGYEIPDDPDTPEDEWEWVDGVDTPAFRLSFMTGGYVLLQDGVGGTYYKLYGANDEGQLTSITTKSFKKSGKVAE